MIDSSSRIGFNASRRIRKLATRMASSPIASSPIKNGSLVRPEKFKVISGPVMGPTAMMALLAMATFWNVVRFRCHQRGSNDALTPHSRHGFEAAFRLVFESVAAGGHSGADPMPLADKRDADWVQILVRSIPSPLLAGRSPSGPHFYLIERWRRKALTSSR